MWSSAQVRATDAMAAARTSGSLHAVQAAILQAKKVGVGETLIISAERSLARRKCTEALLEAQKSKNMGAIETAIEAAAKAKVCVLLSTLLSL